MLCEKLGIASIRELLRRLTSQEISEWIVYYNIQAADQKLDEDMIAAKQKARRL